MSTISQPSAAGCRAWGWRSETTIPGDYSMLAQLRDPDGNLITLATTPARPFPRA